MNNDKYEPEGQVFPYNPELSELETAARTNIEESLSRIDHGFDRLEGAISIDRKAGELSATIGTEAVIDKAAELSAFARLDASFYDSPANLFVLLAVASSWIANEQHAARSSAYDPDIVAEGTMLADTLLVMAGRQSGLIRELHARDPDAARKYYATEVTAATGEEQAFLESIRDHGLEERVAAILTRPSGPGSIMGELGEKLNLSSDEIPPIHIAVSRLGQPELMRVSGLMAELAAPPRAAMAGNALASMRDFRERHGALREYNDNTRRYVEEFQPYFGELSLGSISFNSDGSATIWLSGPTAFAFASYYENSGSGSDRESLIPPDDELLNLMRTTLLHELVHLFRGMGGIALALDEHNADYAAGSRSYPELRLFLGQVGLATSPLLNRALEESVADRDPLSRFAIDTVEGLGLRTFLLLVLARPQSYETDSERVAQSIDLRHLMRPEDRSLLDTLVRQVVAIHGIPRLLHNLARAAMSPTEREDLAVQGELHDLPYVTPYLRRTPNQRSLRP